MSYKTVRKNAKNKINAYIQECEYIEHRYSTSTMDDSYDQHVSVYTIEQALEFYANSSDVDRVIINDENTENEYMDIGGKYYFQDDIHCYKKKPQYAIDKETKQAAEVKAIEAEKLKKESLAGIAKVQITYSENRYINQVKGNRDIIECSYLEAEGILFSAYLSMNGRGGYDKTGINLIFQDGNEYAYRLDLSDDEHGIAQSISQRIEWWCSDENNQQPDLKAFWVGFNDKYQLLFNDDFKEPELMDFIDYSDLLEIVTQAKINYSDFLQAMLNAISVGTNVEYSQLICDPEKEPTELVNSNLSASVLSFHIPTSPIEKMH